GMEAAERVRHDLGKIVVEEYAGQFTRVVLADHDAIGRGEIAIEIRRVQRRRIGDRRAWRQHQLRLDVDGIVGRALVEVMPRRPTAPTEHFWIGESLRLSREWIED